MRRSLLVLAAVALAAPCAAASARAPVVAAEGTLCFESACVHGTPHVFIRDGTFTLARFTARGDSVVARGTLRGKVGAYLDPPGTERRPFALSATLVVRSYSGSCSRLSLRLGPNPVRLQDQTFSVRALEPLEVARRSKPLCTATAAARAAAFNDALGRG